MSPSRVLQQHCVSRSLLVRTCTRAGEKELSSKVLRAAYVDPSRRGSRETTTQQDDEVIIPDPRALLFAAALCRDALC
jgi:hypothetical protein